MKKSILNFYYKLNFFDFSIKFLNIIFFGIKSHSYLMKNIAKFELGHLKCYFGGIV